jgi:hypothetical protein
MRYLLPLLLIVFFAKSQAQVSFGNAEKINNNWRFLRIDPSWNITESADMKDTHFDDSQWRRITLPHDWGVERPMSPDKGSCQGYLSGGIGWYRHVLSIPTESQQGKLFFLYFEGVYNHSEVYVNGQLLGKRPSGFASFLYNITPYLNKESQYTIAVRVDHSQEADSRWYTGSGINRNVWLITSPEVHLAQWGTAYRLKSIDKKKAMIEVDVETTDDRSDKTTVFRQKAYVELRDAESKLVVQASTTIGPQEKKTVLLTIKNPQRWTLEHPYLYTLTTRLENGDKSTVKAGLRTLEFSPDKGFALNGTWMKVKGVCVHDDAGVLGTAVPKEVWKRRLQELKSIGVNAIRMSHNPHMPEFYDLCDELGLLVMDEASDEWEFPKRKWMKGWNQGKPEFQGTYTFFEEWIDRDVADMVRRDRNHPSVFLWSIGNEVDYPNDPYSHPILNGNGSDFTQPAYGGYKPEQPHADRIGKIAQRLARMVKDIDPSRPTTGALAGVVMSNETIYPEVVDVVGYNYTESRYDIDHQRYPKRVIYGSENRHDLPSWRAVMDNEHIFGQFLWTGIDYLGESGVWPARGSSAGLLDLAGQRKPLGWYRAALWSEEPVCYIGTIFQSRRRMGGRTSPYATDTWNYEPGQTIRVMCYTNAPSARLLLNGKPIGGEPQCDKTTNILYWDIPYATGTLRCEATNGASYEICTTKAPSALLVRTDSLQHVFIEIVDEDGHLVKTADNEIQLTVRGARLLGIENGNIMDTSVAGCQRTNRLRAFNGRLVAFIQPINENEAVFIRATSPFLKTASISIE